jgi:hypothetical protein
MVGNGLLEGAAFWLSVRAAQPKETYRAWLRWLSPELSLKALARDHRVHSTVEFLMTVLPTW